MIIILIFHCYARDHQVARTMTSELPALSGKVCLVTGASRGIGKGIALILAKARATVYITGQFLSTKISFLKGKVWRIFTWILELIMGFSCPSPLGTLRSETRRL